MITEKEITEFAHPDYIEQVREAFKKARELQQKDHSRIYQVDCYGEIRSIDKKNTFNLPPGSVKSDPNERQKIFSKPKKEYWGFRDSDKLEKEQMKLLEKILEEKRKNGEDI